MVPAYHLPPNADHLTIMRVLCKETFGQQLVEAFSADFAEACAELDVTGGLHHLDRQRAKTGTGY
jgi:glutamate decarboxylase